MKKMIYMITICLITLGFSGMAQATEASAAAGDGAIDLDGADTGMSAISISQSGVVSYSSETTAGGYGGAAEGDQCAVNTTSSKGALGVALEFLMRNSEGEGDNNLYQNLVDVVGVLTGPETDPEAEGSVWTIRGE